ncbi:MAG: hypothetical protein NC938_02785 [Candidatus Omnitrophica bacterium]|nr:hypothetical protein [Candidatus Omnitrophota bacterium]
MIWTPWVMITDVWIHNASLAALPTLVALSFGNKCLRVHYEKASWAVRAFIPCFERLINTRIEMLKYSYSLADLKVDGRSMGVNFEIDLTNLARKILTRLKTRERYKEIISRLPEEEVDIFFELKICEDLFFVARLLSIVRWHVSASCDKTLQLVLCPSTPISKELTSLRENEYIRVRTYYSPAYALYALKNAVRDAFNKRFFLRRLVGEGLDLSDRSGRVAVHFVDGADTEKKSDIFWYRRSGIGAGRMLIYFDHYRNAKVPISGAVIDEVERTGIPWVCLYESILHLQGRKVSRQKNPAFRLNYDEVPKLKTGGAKGVDRWIVDNFRTLSVQITMALRFYKLFNIKVVFDLSAPHLELVAERIALDMTGGIRIGAQRSALKGTEYQYALRYNANHLLFVWGSVITTHRGTSRALREFIISGYPFDAAFQDKPLSGSIFLEDGRRVPKRAFTIALFDNAYNTKGPFSKNMMALFYKKFLAWLIEDDGLAIIMKEKKQSSFFDSLPDIDKVFSDALKTGRLVRLNNSAGYFPSQVARHADIAVGIGISSAVIEAVVTGSRGVLCDLPGHRSNPLYIWGYDKIVFDDIDRLIDFLKKMKKDPQREAGYLGWAPHIDEIEPFRDGRAGERIGGYIKSLLESLEKGQTQAEAMDRARDDYMRRWGSDKVLVKCGE